MTMTSKLIRIVFCLFALLPLVSLRAQDDAESVKARMKARSGDLDAAKAAGKIGENNRGFLEARDGADGAQNAMIEAENKDRAIAYKAIAAQNNSTPDEVGKLRAARLAQNSPAGTWIQAADGAWARK